MTWYEEFTSCGATGWSERHLEVLAEPARVGVDDRLRVAERFQQRIHLQDSLFQLTIRRLTNCIHLLYGAYENRGMAVSLVISAPG